MKESLNNKECDKLIDLIKIKCIQCGFEHDPSYIGKRCIRCNKVIQPDICKKCKGCKD